MRRSISSLALIRQTTSTGAPAWLTQWNVKWQALSFVGGHKHDDESFRACCIREVGEELALTAADYHAADEPVGHLEFDAWSRSAGADTHYVLEVFEVQLTPAALDAIRDDPDNCWLTAAEIRDGASADGRPISPTVLRVLGELGELDLSA